MKTSDVQRIAIEVAQEQGDRLKVEGAVPAEGETAYTEIILTIRGCQDEPCQVVIGVNRDASESSVRTNVAERLRDHLHDHSAKMASTRRPS
jgi:hypothetical protein